MMKLRLRRTRKPWLEGRISHGLRAMLADDFDGDFTLGEIFDYLAGRGHAALMVVMALLTFLPVISVVTGPILVFVGLRFSFGKRPWLPKWLLERTVQRATIASIANTCERIEKRTARILRPRAVGLVRNIWLHRALGVVVAICGALLPLPIPFTNIPLAVPVIVIGLALLEDDGLYASIGLALGVLVLSSLAAATWFGSAGLGYLWHHYFPRDDAGG
ncbi:MAG: exopolysaccharide biosynthesis protein [Opitutaceae bacterium]|nr:exopolysaccharide biosynthesis protein [Opitutaceae bacterium]